METHFIAGTHFDQFAAGYGTPPGVAMLRAGQISRRLLMLRAITDLATRHPQWSSRLDDQYALLVAAEELAPDLVVDTVAAPHFGAWAAVALREVRAGEGRALGHLGAIAAAAAVRAGLDFAIDLPGGGGGVMLPGLGRAATVHDMVTVTGKAGEYRVADVLIPPDPAVDGPDWLGLRRLGADVDGCTIQLCLDDLDPYRDTYRLNASGRLSRVEVERWQRMLDDAWTLLVRHHRRYAEAIAAGLVSVVPLQRPKSGHSINATSMHAFGSVSLTPATDHLGLASSLLHEFQHAKLGAVLDLVPLYHDDGVRRFYAPWRDDPRPLGGLLQGVYAFLGVSDFWRVQRAVSDGGEGSFAQFEFARWRDRVWRTFRLLEESDRFNANGRRFLAGMRATQTGWLAEHVPEQAQLLADDAAVDHWTGWRLRNLRPDPEQLAELCAAWMDGARCPSRHVATTVVPGDVRARARNARLDLTMIRFADPERFAGACAQPSEFTRAVPAATPGDAAYAAGDYPTAARAYCECVLAEPDNPAGWVGLALARRRLGGPDRQLWQDTPELPYGLHRTVREAGGPPADPVELAGWLAAGATDHTGGGSTTQWSRRPWTTSSISG